MTILETINDISDFYITSEKIDKYKPDWSILVFGIGCIGLFFISVLWTGSIMGMEYPYEWKVGLGFSFVIFSAMILMPSLCYDNVCGVAITLHGINTSLTTKFALSNNVDRDAKKIKKVVDKYVKLAHQIDADQKLKDAEEKKLKQECCTRYNDVIQKVKTE
jgi:hypothetical protein